MEVEVRKSRLQFVEGLGVAKVDERTLSRKFIVWEHASHSKKLSPFSFRRSVVSVRYVVSRDSR